MPQFEVGQLVRIRDVIWSKNCGKRGVVRAGTANKQGRTSLDKYLVEFSDGTRSEFWSIQLAPDDVQHRDLAEPA